VGIGTASPSQLLELAADTADDLKIRFLENGVSDSFIYFDMSADWIGWSSGGADHALGINTGSGNVGIGTSDPQAQVHIEGPNNTSYMLQLKNTGSAYMIESLARADETQYHPI
jgi:hypothetical protein